MHFTDLVIIDLGLERLGLNEMLNTKTRSAVVRGCVDTDLVTMGP